MSKTTLANYSARLGNLSTDQFQRALDRFDLGKFIRAERIPYGISGQNVYLTSSKGEYVLRGVPHYPWQFPAERFFANLLHQHTKAPVPYPYLVDDSTDIFGWSYVIMPRLPGLTLQDPTVKQRLTGDDRVKIARAAAGMLVEIQSLAFDACGSYQLETNRIEPFERHYRERVVQNIREKIAAACRLNQNTTRSDRQFIEALLNSTEGVLYEPFQPTLVCGDYGEHNLLVTRRADQWQVSGVFDLMTAHIGDGAADLSVSVMGYLKEDKSLADAFQHAYREKRSGTQNFAALQQLYMLDATLSFWKFFQQVEGGMPEDATKSWSYERWAAPFIEYWQE